MRYIKELKLLAVVLVSLGLVLSGNFLFPIVSGQAQVDQVNRVGCPEGSEQCPSRYDSFTTAKKVYQPEEEITLRFRNLKDFNYKIRWLKIFQREEFGAKYELVYSNSSIGSISPEKTVWKFTWDQTNDAGEPLERGYFLARLKTKCCGYYRVYFRTVQGVTVPQTSAVFEEEEETEEAAAEVSETAPAEVSAMQVPRGPSVLYAYPAEGLKIELRWKDSAEDEEGYRIFRNGRSVATLSADTTSYIDTGLQPGTRYDYRVVAFNEAGESAPSNIASTTSLGGGKVPESDQGPQREFLGELSELAGPPSVQAEEELPSVLPSLSEEAEGPECPSSLPEGFAEDVSEICPERPETVEPERMEEEGREVQEKVTPPSSPGSLYAYSTGKGAIELRWSDNAQEERGYRVFRNGDLVATLPPGTTSYIDTGLQPGTRYDYRVVAFNEAGESAPSNIASTTSAWGNGITRLIEETDIDRRDLVAGIGIVVTVISYVSFQNSK